MVDSCRDELLHHITFTPHLPPPLHFFQLLSFTAATQKRTQYAWQVLRCTLFLKHFVRKSKDPNCKQRSSCGCLLCIGSFPIYQRLYPSGERSERDGLWSVHICRTKEEEAFSDVSARCTAFMGLRYNPFGPLLFFSSHYCISEVMQTRG